MTHNELRALCDAPLVPPTIEGCKVFKESCKALLNDVEKMARTRINLEAQLKATREVLEPLAKLEILDFYRSDITHIAASMKISDIRRARAALAAPSSPA